MGSKPLWRLWKPPPQPRPPAPLSYLSIEQRPPLQPSRKCRESSLAYIKNISPVTPNLQYKFHALQEQAVYILVHQAYKKCILVLYGKQVFSCSVKGLHFHFFWECRTLCKFIQYPWKKQYNGWLSQDNSCIHISSISYTEWKNTVHSALSLW